MINAIVEEVLNASWATHQAAKEGYAAFWRRFPYWWHHRSYRRTVKRVESWWENPETCPY